MHKMAVLVDGGFYLKRAKNLRGELDPKERASELARYCRAHANHENAELYRIFYYDCDPIAKKVFHPLHNRTFDQSKTPEYAWKTSFFDELAKIRKLAIRKGQTLETSGEFVLKSSVSKDLVRGKRNVGSLDDSDYILDVQQKGVDVRIGLDVALIAMNRYADRDVGRPLAALQLPDRHDVQSPCLPCIRLVLAWPRAGLQPLCAGPILCDLRPDRCPAN